MAQSQHFTFDAPAGSYIGTLILSALLTVITAGLAYPWALCMKQRWITNHTYIDGRKLKFIGSGGGLIGQWIKWWFLCLITVGIYSLWIPGALAKWIVLHTDYEGT
jgi:uncharacterized membrane protein YjgN (DUF898 family)